MRTTPGRVAEIQLHLGQASPLIACPTKLVPSAGQYLLANDDKSILPTPLFLARASRQGFMAAPPYPDTWLPGTSLTLHGPLGHGFRLPMDVQRLALVVLGDTYARLLSLVTAVDVDNLSITLFSDASLTDLPPSLEAYPLQDLRESISWADFIVVDVPIEELDQLPEYFVPGPQGSFQPRGQVLVHGGMPCGSLGECGICAVKVKRSWRLACQDGPVFDLQAVLQGIS